MKKIIDFLEYKIRRAEKDEVELSREERKRIAERKVREKMLYGNLLE